MSTSTPSYSSEKRARVVAALAHEAGVTLAQAGAMLVRHKAVAARHDHERISEIVAHVLDEEDHAIRSAYVETPFARRHIEAERARVRGAATGDEPLTAEELKTLAQMRVGWGPLPPNIARIDAKTKTGSLTDAEKRELVAFFKEHKRPLGTPRFVIRWHTYGYVTKGQPNRKPYAHDARDADVQHWASRQAAERFLSRKDPSWAASCVIEEIEASERAHDKGGAAGRALGTPHFVRQMRARRMGDVESAVDVELDDVRYTLLVRGEHVVGVGYTAGGRALAHDPSAKGYASQVARVEHLKQWWAERVAGRVAGRGNASGASQKSVALTKTETRILQEAAGQHSGAFSVTTTHFKDYTAGGRLLDAAQSLVAKGLMEKTVAEPSRKWMGGGQSRAYMTYAFRITEAGRTLLTKAMQS